MPAAHPLPRPRALFSLPFVGLCLSLCACVSPPSVPAKSVPSTPSAPSEVADNEAPEPPTDQADDHIPSIRSESRVLAHSRENRALRVETYEAESVDETVLILATIHGDEAAGTPLVHRLANHLLAHPEDLGPRRLVIIPVANPDGYAHSTRGNSRSVDLNRNFPASNFSGQNSPDRRPLSEPESQAIAEAIEHYRPTRILSIHQPLRCVDYDGPGAGLARAIALQCPMPVKKLGGRPGSLGSYAGDNLGIPTITFELPRRADRESPEALWSRYGQALIAFLQFSAPTP